MIKTTYPPLPTWTAYADAVQAYEGLHDDLAEAYRLMDGLRLGQPDAEKADDAAQATALRAGKADPGRKATVKWKADKASAEGRIRVLETAVAQQEQVIQTLLRNEREQAVQAAQEARADAAARYRRSLGDVVNSRDAFYATGRTLAWAEKGGSVRFKQQSAPGLNVPGAATRNGEPLPVSAVLNALAAEADNVTTQASVALFSSAAAQTAGNVEPQIRMTIPDPTGTGPDLLVLVDPDDPQAYAEAKAQQTAALLERDRLENLAAAQSAAMQQDRPA